MTRYAFKITLLGDGAVGKTSLRRSFMGQTFVANHLSTIGADFSAQKIYLDNNDQVEFQIWDLAGQPGFKGIRSRFYGGTRGSFFVFDLTNQQSFENISPWIEELFKHNGIGQVPIMLIGNKVDLENARIVDKGKVEEFRYSLENQLNDEVKYFETSAKTGENVQEAFRTFAEVLREKTG